MPFCASEGAKAGLAVNSASCSGSRGRAGAEVGVEVGAGTAAGVTCPGSGRVGSTSARLTQLGTGVSGASKSGSASVSEEDGSLDLSALGARDIDVGVDNGAVWY